MKADFLNLDNMRANLKYELAKVNKEVKDAMDYKNRSLKKGHSSTTKLHLDKYGWSGLFIPLDYTNLAESIPDWKDLKMLKSPLNIQMNSKNASVMCHRSSILILFFRFPF